MFKIWEQLETLSPIVSAKIQTIIKAVLDIIEK
jgi:hypothetical protein